MAVQTACTLTLLETVILNIVEDHGNTHKARALLDSASMSNFISKPLAKNLYSRRSTADVSVAGIGSSTQKISSAITATIESGDRTISIKLQFLALKQPSSDLPTIDISKISLGEGLPWVVKTPFGWAVTGPASRSATCIPRFCYLSTADDRLEAALRKFWDMETIPSGPVRSSEENRCEELYAATTTRDATGRDPATKDSYDRFMDEYLHLGHMKKVSEPDDRIPHCHIPHHVVFKESSTTTKIRVVFDASCKTSSGFSLNDTLLVGPVVQQDLYSIYLRFRTRNIAVVADVEKMYRQVLHHPEDLSFLRIRHRTSSSDPIETYELQTVTYALLSAGTASRGA
ncbi:uncharacterized protein LOC134290369 [Aedes albopictus]|uniref:Peptidase aspartic putative domain-containing protein n=1 Tax=Aedes albopictus TaxID=7160 RepID=A0ABM1ZSP8_AEDAL